MFATLVLFTCLMVISTTTDAHIEALSKGPSKGLSSSKTVELGKVVDLRGTNILADFQERQRTIFELFDSKCFIDEKEKVQSSRKFMEYYENSNAFYSSLATQSELDTSLESSYTLGVSLQIATKSKSSQTHKVSGMSLNALAITEKLLVRRGCLEGDEATLKEQFLKDVELLPEKIEKPWLKSSWEPYHSFLKKYGSHVITSVKLGASFRQMTFAESSKSYSQRDFEVKSCLSLAGPTTVGEIGIKACTDISESEKSTANKMSTTDKVFVLGGSPDTRNRLLDQKTRSPEEIQKLLNEASEKSSSIEHTFAAIWNILQSRFKIGSSNHNRGLNLEYYYRGFLSYGCDYVPSTDGGVAIQKFDYTTERFAAFDPTKRSPMISPAFQCSLAKEGCHSSHDCHYKPIWCSCHGSSCVRYTTETQVNGAIKETAYANSNSKWGWHGCSWKVRWSVCHCANSNRDVRKVTWSLPSRDCPTHKARSDNGHRQTEDAAQKRPKGKEEQN